MTQLNLLQGAIQAFNEEGNAGGTKGDAITAAVTDSIATLFEGLGGCPKCGCVGLHACTGHPVVWTQEDKDRLKQVLCNYFDNGEEDKVIGLFNGKGLDQKLV